MSVYYEFATIALSVTGLGVGIIAVVGWVAKNVIVTYLGGKLESYKTELGTSMQKELRALDYEVRIRAHLNESRTSRLDDKRLEVCLGISQRIYEAQVAMEQYTSVTKLFTDSEDKGPHTDLLHIAGVERISLEKKEASIKINEFIRYYQMNEMLFQEDIVRKLNELIDVLREAFHKYNSWCWLPDKDMTLDIRKEVYDAKQKAEIVTRSILPKAHQEIKRRFFDMIAPDPVECPKPEPR